MGFKGLTRLNRYLTVCFIAILLLSSKALPADKDQIFEYAPFFKGSSWLYKTSDGVKEEIKATDYKRIAGLKTVTLESSISGKTSFVFTKDTLFRFKSILEAKDTILYSNGLEMLKSPLAKGSLWASDLGVRGDMTIEVLDYEDISTPAGEFKKTLKVGVRLSKGPLFDGILWFAKGVGIVQTLENHFLKTLVSYKTGNPDLTIINDISSLAFLKKLKPADFGLPGMDDGSPNDSASKSVAIKTIKMIFKPANLFILAVLVILFFFIVILVRVSGFLGGEVDNLSKESKKHLAKTFISTGNFKKAEKIIRELMKDTQVFPDTLNALGVSLKGQKKLLDSIECFRKALVQNPDYKEAKINLAKTLFMVQKTDESMELLKGLVAENPMYSDLHNLLAEIYIMKGKKDLAKGHLLKAIEINPAYERAQRNLKKVETVQGESNE